MSLLLGVSNITPTGITHTGKQAMWRGDIQQALSEPGDLRRAAASSNCLASHFLVAGREFFEKKTKHASL